MLVAIPPMAETVGTDKAAKRILQKNGQFADIQAGKCWNFMQKGLYFVQCRCQLQAGVCCHGRKVFHKSADACNKKGSGTVASQCKQADN